MPPVSLLLAGLLLATISGCVPFASDTTSTLQPVRVDVVNAPGATCLGVDKKGRKYHWPNTPYTTEVQRGDGPMTLTCQKHGYKKTEHTVHQIWRGLIFRGMFDPLWPVEALFDIASGAALEYPNLVKLTMEPDGAASDAEKTKYQTLKKQLEEEMKKQEAQEQAQTKGASGDETPK